MRVSFLNDRNVYKISQSYEFLNKNKMTIPNGIPRLIGVHAQDTTPRHIGNSFLKEGESVLSHHKKP